MPVTSWSTIASNNNAAPPNGFPEGQSPASLNDACRELMASCAREFQVNAVKALNTVSGTNTITADMDPELASYAAGMLVIITPAATNTTAVTLAIDGLTALDVLKADGDALVAGDLVIGVPALLLLDSGADDFYLLNPQTAFTAIEAATATLATVSSGTYTPAGSTVANCSALTVGPHRYSRIGNIVTVTGTAGFTVTSGGGVSTQLTIALPVASAFTNAAQAVGVGVTDVSNAESVYVQSEPTSDRLILIFISTTSGAHVIYYTAQYEVI